MTKNVIKLTTLNNQLYFHIIWETLGNNSIKNAGKTELHDIYISYTKMYNLIINEGEAITIKKAIDENNDKNFKPRPEIIGKIDKVKNNYVLKIGVGKNYKKIETIEDVEKKYIIPIDNYIEISKFVTSDFENFEKYEELRKELRKQQTTKNNTKTIDGF